jgi:Tol biopolymer transport system component
MRLAVAGGPAQKVFDDEAGYLGAAWGPDDNLVVALFRGGRQNGLYRIPASGAVTLERLTPEGDQNVLYAAPTFLPNGKGVLFYLIGLGQPQTEQLAVLDLATRQQRILVDAGANPMYSTSGHLVFARGTTLMAVPFDQERLEFRGTPLVVQAGVRHPNPSTATDYGLSRNGTLIYVPSSDSDPVAARRIVWVDRNGRVVGAPVGNEIGSYRGLQISPDGQRVVVSSNGVVTGSRPQRAAPLATRERCANACVGASVVSGSEEGVFCLESICCYDLATPFDSERWQLAGP